MRWHVAASALLAALVAVLVFAWLAPIAPGNSPFVGITPPHFGTSRDVAIYRVGVEEPPGECEQLFPVTGQDDSGFAGAIADAKGQALARVGNAILLKETVISDYVDASDQTNAGATYSVVGHAILCEPPADD